MKKDSSKRVLITGITGFAGSHLAELLLKKKFDVFGIARWRSKTENIEHNRSYLHLVEADLLDSHSLQRIMIDIRPDYIFHLAGQSFVPASWTSPAVTLEINTVGSANLFEAVRSTKIDPIIQIACCYDEATKALTDKGLKSFREIKEGELVLSINPKNKEVAWKPVKKVIVDDYKGKMVHIKGKRIDLMMTPNHQCYFENKKGGLKSIFAKDLHGDYQLPKGQGKGEHPQKIEGFPAEDLLYLLGLYVGDGYGDANKRMFIIKTGLSRKEYLRYCRDKQGKFKRMKENPSVGFSSTARVFLAIPKDGKARKSVESCLRNLKIKFFGYDDCLYFSSKKLLKILKTTGENAGEKHIPCWVFKYSPGLLKELYEGIIDSDGCWRKKRETLTTVSIRLIETFIELCARLGFTCSYQFLNSRKSLLKENRVIKTNKKGIYSLSVSHRFKQVRNSLNVYQEEYGGKIWCVEVIDNHTLLVVRNGKVDFSGNSSEEYGLVKPEEVPIKETNPLRPLSPYAVSKIAMDYLGFQYFKSYQMKIVRTRAFNHTGPRRGDVFAESTFAKQIAEIEKRKREPVVLVGNLEAKRDYTDVRDMVNGYFLAATKGEPGEVYNICSGKAVKISQILEILVKMSKIRVEVRQDPARMRPSDVLVLHGDNSKFKKRTGWSPKIPLEKTLEDLLNYWRERV